MMIDRDTLRLHIDGFESSYEALEEQVDMCIETGGNDYGVKIDDFTLEMSDTVQEAMSEVWLGSSVDEECNKIIRSLEVCIAIATWKEMQ